MTNDHFQDKAITNALWLVHLLFSPPPSRIGVLEKVRVFEIPSPPVPSPTLGRGAPIMQLVFLSNGEEPIMHMGFLSLAVSLGILPEVEDLYFTVG